jgi:serine/threonine protein kinase
VHRDLKPGNVMLTATGAKVLDFGLAAHRRPPAAAHPIHAHTTVVRDDAARSTLGTTPYLAPERLQGRPDDHRADIFAFGVVLYEMIAGRRPFAGETQAAVIAAILTGEPAPLDTAGPLGGDVDWVVRTALARNPDARWQSLGDIARVLKRLSRGRPAAPPSRPRSQRAMAASVVGALLLLIAGLAMQTLK